VKKERIYITTTLPYVNSDPHIGFALEIVQADSIARYKRILGDSVFFNTGTDEHGQKIWEASQKEGLDVQDYVDKYAKKFDDLKEALNLSYDNFVRTTDDSHVKAAQEFWKRADAKGDIYKKKYSGNYCVGHEAYLTERDLVDGKCPDHPNTPMQVVEEENYFFKASNYSKEIKDYLNTDGVITPEFRRQEALNLVKEGMEDFSISRLKSKMSWGIPVPGDDEHVMYVWFDALVNYISTLGWPEKNNFDEFWSGGKTIQMAGKDQVRFQSLMWQTMLMSVGVKNTKQIFYHGFITSEGQKISKSIGNVINPIEVVKKYGTDAVRYYLLRHIHPYDDSDFTEERFVDSYNAHLANGIGNLTARVLKMASDYEVDYDAKDKEEVWFSKDNRQYIDYLDKYEFNKALDWLWASVGALDEYIATEEPFKVIKVDEDKAKDIVKRSVLKLYEVAVLLEPILPDTSFKIQQAVSKREKPESLFVRI